MGGVVWRLPKRPSQSLSHHYTSYSMSTEQFVSSKTHELTMQMRFDTMRFAYFLQLGVYYVF